jgi:hypothetical protein
MAFYHEKLRIKFPDAGLNDWEISFVKDIGFRLNWFRPEPAPDLNALDAEIPDLEIIKRLKLATLTAARNAALAALTATWDGDEWDANEETSNRIANALSMIREAEAQGIPAPGSIAWRTADNRTRVLTLPQLTAMGAAVFGAQQMIWAVNAALKDTVIAATTIEEVEAVNWPDA